MFDQVFENLTKATESSAALQREMFEKWMEAFPTAAPAATMPADAFTAWRKNWEQISAEMLKRQKAADCLSKSLLETIIETASLCWRQPSQLSFLSFLSFFNFQSLLRKGQKG